MVAGFRSSDRRTASPNPDHLGSVAVRRKSSVATGGGVEGFVDLLEREGLVFENGGVELSGAGKIGHVLASAVEYLWPGDPE